MPTISWFFGIAIRMYFNDHNPPHFHAVHDREEAVIAIETGAIVEGRLSPNARRLVQEWALRHREELMDNWNRARPGTREPLQRIPGLDADDD
jgi:hypothetical protein